ncbi:hypothetical protein MKX01_040334 [Papaver californicum]|nr:hypothetical protein MKX01_040334 [Papaver californicum]
MIMRGPITPWEFNAARCHPVSTPYDYLIGCHNELAKLHTSHADACDKVGGVIIMHIDDLRKFALLWLHKTEEVRADKAHYSKNITGDIYESGWASEMYGYSFGAAEVMFLSLVSTIGCSTMDCNSLLEIGVLMNTCWAKFPDPPNASILDSTDTNIISRDQLSIECGSTLNEALRLHHISRNFTFPRRIGKVDGIPVVVTADTPPRDTRTGESTHPNIRDPMFSSFRFWIVVLWAFSVMGFLIIVGKGSHHRNKRRASYSAFPDTTDRHDKHPYNNLLIVVQD